MRKFLPLKYISIVAFAFLLLGFSYLSTPLEQLLANLSKQTESYPQEKVHLHTDKPYYAIGEDIWFKAYVVTAEKNEPSLLSAVLYVELINEKNEVKKAVRVAVDKGLGAGNIPLIDSLTAGTYRLRAYTSYMRNYDAGFFYEKFVVIGDVLESAAPAKELKGELGLQFFPEGGNLVAGIRSRVGVKAVQADGTGANLSGYIANKDNEKVAVFETEHAGMGSFAFTPVAGDKYTAVVSFAGGESKGYRLPEAQASGYVLSVVPSGENVKVLINTSAGLNQGQELHVVGQSNGKAYVSFQFKAEKNSFVASVPKKSLPTGITQFTLFDNTNTPLAERLVFTDHSDALKIGISQTGSGTRQKATLNLNVTDVAGTPADGSFSVSVTDMGKVAYNEEDETTILSNLLLSSDIRGYIEQPNYYFTNTDDNKRRQLDNLLLSQGWRRFVWKDIAAGKEPEISHRPELALEIAGRITTLGGKPLTGAKVLLLSTTPDFPLLLDTVTDARGNFVFDRLDIPDSATFSVQAKGLKNSQDVVIKVTEGAGVTVKPYFGKTTDLSAYLETTKEQFSVLVDQNMLDKRILIREVQIQAPKQIKVVNVVGSANVMGTADAIFGKERLEYETSLLMAFSKIPGITIKDNKVFSASSRKTSITGNKTPMLFLVNGVEVMQDEILIMNPRDIEGIEILVSNYNLTVYGEPGLHGVAHITMKRGKDRPPSTMAFKRVKSRGYSVIKEFYAPDYDDPNINKNMQDQRSTIFWKPNVITDTNGKGSLSFFNSAAPGTYRVTVEGMDAFGNIGRNVFTYKVQ